MFPVPAQMPAQALCACALLACVLLPVAMAAVPIIDYVSGCTFVLGDSLHTAQCNTEGGQELAILGKHFNPPVTVYVSSALLSACLLAQVRHWLTRWLRRSPAACARSRILSSLTESAAQSRCGVVD